MKKILTFVLFLILLASLIILRPTKTQFARWYVSENPSGYGRFIDDTMEMVVKKNTEEDKYLVFSVFEVNDEDRYIGVCGLFIGRSTFEEAQHAFKSIAQKALEAAGGEEEDDT